MLRLGWLFPCGSLSTCARERRKRTLAPGWACERKLCLPMRLSLFPKSWHISLHSDQANSPAQIARHGHGVCVILHADAGAAGAGAGARRGESGDAVDGFAGHGRDTCPAGGWGRTAVSGTGMASNCCLSSLLLVSR